MAFTRRSLMNRGALLVAAGLLAPSFLTRTALALDDGQTNPLNAAAASAPTKNNRILVVLQLSGGKPPLRHIRRLQILNEGSHVRWRRLLCMHRGK